jgi:hypothetical protein
MDIGIAIAVAGCVIAIATFFIGRLSAAHGGGREMGAIKTYLENIEKTIMRLETDFKDSRRDFNESVRKEEEARMDADRRLHGRIDEHVALFHNVNRVNFQNTRNIRGTNKRFSRQ